MKKSFTKKMNLKHGIVENAYIIKNVHLSLSAYDTLCLICSELNINLDNVNDDDFYSASVVLDAFCRSSNNSTGYTVSVWFDK